MNFLLLVDYCVLISLNCNLPAHLVSGTLFAQLVSPTFQIDVHLIYSSKDTVPRLPTLDISSETILNSIQDLAGVHNTTLIEELFDTFHDLDAFLALRVMQCVQLHQSHTMFRRNGTLVGGCSGAVSTNTSYYGGKAQRVPTSSYTNGSSASSISLEYTSAMTFRWRFPAVSISKSVNSQRE